MSDDLFNLQPPAANEVPVRLYRPSNGTEGVIFMDAWCSKCAKDAEMNGTVRSGDAKPEQLCPIIAATMAYDEDDPKYPREWQYDASDHPVCTAFVPLPVIADAPPDTREAWQKELDRVSGANP